MSDRIIHTAGIGADGTPSVDDSPGRLFPWLSLTKTVLAGTVFQLVARGLLTLDDGLPGRPCALRQLLQHRAGVPNYGRLAAYHAAVKTGDSPWPVDDPLERVSADRLDRMRPARPAAPPVAFR